MEKKQYILPSIEACEVKYSAMICGSGENNANMSLGDSSGDDIPKPIDDIIHIDSKIGVDFDDFGLDIQGL